MKMRGLLSAVILLAVLGGLLYWSNKRQKAEAAKPSTTAPAQAKILSLPEDQVKEISLKKSGGDALVLRKGDDGKWQITDPKPVRADQDSVKSLIGTLASLNADQTVEDHATNLAPYGLNSPGLDVVVTKKDGKTSDLLLGDDVPTGSGTYVKLVNDPHVYTVSSYVKTGLNKTADDLRDKRLLTFDQDKLTRLDLNAKGETIEFGKNNQNDWQILKPKPLRADAQQVDDLVRKLKDAKMDPTVTPDDAKKAAAAYASGAKVATATVADANGTQTLEIHQDKDKTYYAKSSAVEGIYKVSADLGGGVDKKLDDFRNKKLFDFGWTDPDKLQIGKATYTKTGDKWMDGARQMDPPTVESVVDKLRELSAAKFPETGGGGATVLELMVSSNGAKRVEKVTITKLGDTYFAKRENEPGIYELDGKGVDDLQKAAAQVREAQPPKKK
jgi:hypothetical protein